SAADPDTDRLRQRVLVFDGQHVPCGLQLPDGDVPARVDDLPGDVGVASDPVVDVARDRVAGQSDLNAAVVRGRECDGALRVPLHPYRAVPQLGLPGIAAAVHLGLE